MSQAARIPQPWLSITRVAWFLLAALNLLPGLIGLPDYFRQLVALDPWPNRLGWTQATFSAAVTQVGISPQIIAWIIFVPALLSILVFLSLGLLIFLRKSNEWFGLLASFVMVSLAGTFAGDQYQFLEALPAVWQIVVREVNISIWLVFIILLVLFPDGRFKPAWMRWLAAGLAAWFFLLEATTLAIYEAPGWIYIIGMLLLALLLVGKTYRYRRLSSPIEQQQTRGFLFAITVMITFNILLDASEQVFPLSEQPGLIELVTYLVVAYASMFIFLLIPVSIVVAIFRYRLWDIDLVIRRTLVYTALTVLLGLVYFSSVVLLRQLLSPLTGKSTLAVVLSTLLIAALFEPVRRRVQTFIDQRFYRQKYDAALTLEAFSTAARHEVELDSLTTRLVGVLEHTVQPERVSVWLRKGRRQT